MKTQQKTADAARVGSTGGSARRSYAAEMAYAIGKAMAANHDRNPNRAAEVNGWLEYGHLVDIARRSHEPIPERPTRRFI